MTKYSMKSLMNRFRSGDASAKGTESRGGLHPKFLAEAEPCQLRPNDVFLASFPRSGNTWVRVIIANILHPNRLLQSLSELDELTPDIHKGLPDDAGGRRVIKTHRPFFLRHGRNEPRLYQRAIYIVRHPYNVARSLFHYLSFQDKVESWEDVLSVMILGNARWGSWQSNVLSWRSAGDEREVLMLRYEDLQGELDEGVRRIADFLGESVDDKLLEKVAQCLFLGRHALARAKRLDSIQGF